MLVNYVIILTHFKLNLKYSSRCIFCRFVWFEI